MTKAESLKQAMAAATEAQLLSEEKWLIDALKHVRRQRNSYQIERLHLESLKAKMLLSKSNGKADTPMPSPGPSPVDLMQSIPSRSKIMFEEPNVEVACNNEELNLNVSNSIFNQELPLAEDNMEEYEEDDNLIVDINMLMDTRRCNEN